MKKTFIMILLLIGLILVLGRASVQTSWAEEVVCGQWRRAYCSFSGSNTPVFQPCGSSQLWVLDPTGAYSLFQEGQFVRLYSPRVSYDEGFECEGQKAGYLWTARLSEPIGSCSACLPARVNFWADSTSITRGQCTTVRWQVDNVEAVYFNGEGTGGYGSRQVCPTTSTNYNLAVVKDGQTTNYSVVVNVSEPALVDNSAYVADVTIPDGTIVIPGQAFTKIWRVRNSGNTAWSTGYQLVYVSGERFGASTATPLKAEVAPGQQVDLDLALKAPQRSGTYTGIFMLRSADGKLFGTKLTVVVKVPTFIVTYMELDPAKPIQRQPFKLRVYYDLVGSLEDYPARFNGEVLLRNSKGQIVERATFDKSNATFLPDAEALRKDPNFRKWVLTVRNVSFRGWSDSVTIEVWLRPLGPGSGLEYIKASLRASIQADPAAVTRCASFISKKLTLVAPSRLAWVLVGTGTSTRLATCDSVSCVAWEIAQLIARTGGDIARTILAVLNINNMTGAEDCYRLAQ